MNWDWLGMDKAQLLIAGAFGGVVRWLTLRAHWSDGLIAIIVGALCSLYMSQLAMPIVAPFLTNLHVEPESMIGFSGFLTGMGGLSLAGFVIDLFRFAAKFRRQAEPPKGGGGAK